MEHGLDLGHSVLAAHAGTGKVLAAILHHIDLGHGGPAASIWQESH